jgi:hypothetical protein
MSDEPITVTDAPLDGQITTLARYIVTAFGSFALGKGWVDNEGLQLLTGLVTVVLPTAWGIYKTWTAKKQAIALADAAPDFLARLITK